MRFSLCALSSFLLVLPVAQAKEATPAAKLVELASQCASTDARALDDMLVKVSALAPTLGGVRVDASPATAALRSEMERELGDAGRAAIAAFAKTPAGEHLFTELSFAPCHVRDLFTPGGFPVERLNAKGKELLARIFAARRLIVSPMNALPKYQRVQALAPVIDVIADVIAAAGPAIPYGSHFVTSLRGLLVNAQRPEELDLRSLVLTTSKLSEADLASFVAFFSSPAGRVVASYFVDGPRRVAQRLGLTLLSGLSRALNIAEPKKPASVMGAAELEAELQNMDLLK